jgi:hypothetical protein
MIDNSRPVWSRRPDVADARMRRETRDHIERQVGALKLRIGVDHHGNIDGIGNGPKIGFDLRVAERKIGFENGKDAVGAELLIGSRLRDRIRCRGRGDAGDHGHASPSRFDRGLHHSCALRVVEIGELAGRAERRQPMHA